MTAITGLIGLLMLIGLVLSVMQNVSGKAKQREIGDGRGWTMEQMVARLGRPQSISDMGTGEILAQWQQVSQTGGYHYAYIFRDGVCQGMTHMHSSGLG